MSILAIEVLVFLAPDGNYKITNKIDRDIPKSLVLSYKIWQFYCRNNIIPLTSTINRCQKLTNVKYFITMRRLC